MQDDKMIVMLTKPRMFTEEEQSILSKMLSTNVMDKKILINQIENAKVIGYCDCGCKSILISVDQELPKYMYNVRVPVEMLTNDGESTPIQFLLHIVDGYINELEILRLDSQAINGTVSLNNVIITIND